MRGLEHGADDYVAKPFSYPELLLRVRGAAAPRRRRAGAARVRVGALEVDPPTRDVRVGGEPVELSAKEFSLLRALAAEPTRVFTKDELLRDVWGSVARVDADAGLPRLPAAAQARRRRRALRGQRVGRRLPAGRPR